MGALLERGKDNCTGNIRLHLASPACILVNIWISTCNSATALKSHQSQMKLMHGGGCASVTFLFSVSVHIRIIRWRMIRTRRCSSDLLVSPSRVLYAKVLACSAVGTRRETWTSYSKERKQTDWQSQLNHSQATNAKQSQHISTLTIAKNRFANETQLATVFKVMSHKHIHRTKEGQA